MKHCKRALSFILFFGLILSCSNSNIEHFEAQENQLNYPQLTANLDKRIDAFMPYFQNQEAMFSALVPSEYGNSSKGSNAYNVVTIRIDTAIEVKYHKSDISDIYNDKQKNFLLDYFNEAANAEGSELLDIISSYKKALDSNSFSEEEYQQVFFILDSAEKTVISIEQALRESATSKKDNGITSKNNCFWDCMAGKGKEISRGMVGGAISGAVVGGVLGAGGGTVVFPILGTATGAVAGAVFGGAEGAMYGATTAALWATTDCAIKCGQTGGLGGAGGCSRVTEPIGNTGNSMIFQVCN